MYIYKHSLRLALCLVALCALGGCGAKNDGALFKDGFVQDMADFPQDLAIYAAPLGEKMLISSAEQAAADARFNDIYFSPWRKEKAAMSKKAFLRTFGSARGYNGLIPWTKTDWDGLKYQAHPETYPNTQKHAITIRQTPLRELPTLLPRYSKQEASSPFDNFQYSTLAPAMPVYVTQTSRDGQWYFIENPIAGGWVQSKDIAFVSESFIEFYQDHPLAALIEDDVTLISQDMGENTFLDHAHIGAVFPIIASNAEGLTLLMPVAQSASSQQARLTRVFVSHTQAARKPLPLRADLIAKVGNVMMGQEYGWGGTNENRDCSALVRDMFTPFGLWLPRNSLSQYRAGNKLPLENFLDDTTKESVIREKGRPFTSLVWLPGHIALYLGVYNGKAAIFHNIWGVRVDEQGLGDDRHIIGRAVVTSLSPGAELPNLYNNQTLIRRVGGIAHTP